MQHFAARIKGQADLCEYNGKCTNEECGQLVSYAVSEIKDQICNGLNESEILQDLLGHKDQKMTLQDTIYFIASKEAGKRCQSQLSTGASINKISPYKRNKFQSTPTNKPTLPTQTNGHTIADQCTWCGKVGHGKKAPRDSRKSACPAYRKKCNSCNKLGHFSKVCRLRVETQNGVIEAPDETQDADGTQGVVFLDGIECRDDEGVDEIRLAPNCSLPPVTHLEYTDATGWRSCLPKKDPVVHVTIRTSRDAYRINNLDILNSNEANLAAIADTGARTTVAGTKLLAALGLNVEDLFPVDQKLCGANNSRLHIWGGLFLHIKLSTDVDYNTTAAETLCYIQEDSPDKIYVSNRT